MIENGVKLNHRTFLVIVGDKGKEQVVNLHYILSKAVVKARPSVLWCYKKELGFSSHKKKRMKQISSLVKKGLYTAEQDQPFDLFISSTNIRYTYYSDTHKILGNTFGMCVLQDFEALTPNLLARSIETVEGGGLVVLLLNSMSSLKQLYALSMDIHSRFRSDHQKDAVARFNERFILSLGSCKRCLVMDDELNVLPISSHCRSVVPIAVNDENMTPEGKELQELKMSLKDTPPLGDLISIAKTLDQAKALLVFIEAISEKTLRSTVSLTAARGRGKSAALGMAIAAAVAFSYSNIFVTSPSPENLKTLFEFIMKGFDELGYKEHTDYEFVESTNPEFNHAIVRVNIFRTHRQTIQYIQPQDFGKLGQAELVVVDEAAAIPLPIVKSLLGPYLVFMASTINGYEGTGRSLSLKLIQQLRNQAGNTSVTHVKGDTKASSTSHGGRVLREITLEHPIRYGVGDDVEAWMNQLLCLDASKSLVPLAYGCPPPNKCQLYRVNKDALFSFNAESELFLQRMMALYVSSHYKNSPNDLQLMSDAPHHHLFVLLGPVSSSQKDLPDILAVVQVCVEGGLDSSTVKSTLASGELRAGDLIPWTISQQYQDEDFGSLTGIRIVRIATHPDFNRMGYGSHAVKLICDYYQGKMMNLNEDDEEAVDEPKPKEKDDKTNNLLKELVKPRRPPPLLWRLEQIKPLDREIHYLGVSFGMSTDLLKFWKKNGFSTAYIRLTPNEITGEHSCVMLKAAQNAGDVSQDWLNLFTKDFKNRFLSLLQFEFSKFPASLALNILEFDARAGKEFAADQEPELAPNQENDDEPIVQESQQASVDTRGDFTNFDLKRIQSYAKNQVDYHVVLDLTPTIARRFFLSHLPIRLPALQAAILLSIGLQHKNVETIAAEMNLQVNQILALFNKLMRKFASYYQSVLEKEIEKTLPKESAIDAQFQPLTKSLASELKDAEKNVLGNLVDDTLEAGDEEVDVGDGSDEDQSDDEAEAIAKIVKGEAAKEKGKPKKEMTFDPRYIVGGNEDDWKAALSKVSKNRAPANIAIKDAKKRKADAAPQGEAKGKKSAPFKKADKPKKKKADDW
eukprot:TRINITY_DN6209_c0_g1_i1.p1 TRINITY_DN6209_c0_g1~~TRINITY_DN6209_c0_g1_i1.p1  ORF type:complete len:1101 (-),score=571.46 TRINITY_DN6209_c0_g1_i1:37-3276(-)